VIYGRPVPPKQGWRGLTLLSGKCRRCMMVVFEVEVVVEVGVGK
jgi:hypothetical protein